MRLARRALDQAVAVAALLTVRLTDEIREHWALRLIAWRQQTSR